MEFLLSFCSHTTFCTWNPKRKSNSLLTLRKPRVTKLNLCLFSSCNISWSSIWGKITSHWGFVRSSSLNMTLLWEISSLHWRLCLLRRNSWKTFLINPPNCRKILWLFPRLSYSMVEACSFHKGKSGKRREEPFRQYFTLTFWTKWSPWSRGKSIPSWSKLTKRYKISKRLTS